MSDGRTITLNQGESFETSSACEILDFINNLPLNENYGVEREGVIEALTAEAQAEGCIGPDGSVNANPNSGTVSPGTSTAPPAVDGDSGDLQGAPSIPDLGAVRHKPSPSEEGEGDEEPRDHPPGQPDISHGGEQSDQPADGGDPVHLFRGTLYLEETDIVLKTSVMPLALVRRYRSGSPYFGPFGWNWDHNHNVYLRELDNGDIARWDGAQHEDIFHKVGDHFEPQRGVFEVLEANPGLNQSYVITAAGGQQWLFERPLGWLLADRIPLVEVRDRHGNRLHYTYNDTSRLAEVRDDDDRFILFSYGDYGLLEAISDHTGREIHYGYAPDIEHLVCVCYPATTDQPEGISKVYHYDHPSLPPELRHNIVRIEDGDGRTYQENKYDHDPANWSYGRLCEQCSGDYINQFCYISLQYVPPSDVFVNIPATRVEVMNPEYCVTTYTFNYRGDLLDYRYRLSKDRSYRVVAYEFGYDEQGNRTKIRLPDGGEELRIYDPANPDPRMRGKLRRRELRARTGFPAPSRIIWQGTYEPQFQLPCTETDESGHVTEYRYDFDEAVGPGLTGKIRGFRWPDATMPDGTVQSAELRFETNQRGQITAIITPQNHRTEFEYGAALDELGLLTAVHLDTGGLNIEETYRYDARGNVVAQTDGVGAVRRYIYDTLDRTVSYIAPEINGETTAVTMHYDRDGKVVGIERPRGAYHDDTIGDESIRDNFKRDVLAYVVRMVFGENTGDPRTIERCVDFRGLPSQVTDPSGTKVKQGFDERGLRIHRTILGPDGTSKSQRWVYDLVGRPTHVITGNLEDTRTEYEYDGFGRVSKIRSQNKTVFSFTWGERDLISEERVEGDPGDGSQRVLAHREYDYDERGRLARLTEHSFRDNPSAAVMLKTEFYYDLDNNLVRAIGPRNAEFRYVYDGLGRLTEQTDPGGNVRVFDYDECDRLERTEFRDLEVGSVVSRVWTREYDDRGRLIRTVDPDGTTVERRYDDRDLPSVQIEPEGIERHRTYGQLGELLEDVLDPGGLTITHVWTYDKKNRPVLYTDPSGEHTEYIYDGLGRLVRTKMPGGFESERIFGEDGRLRREVLASGIELLFGYDSAGRLNRLESGGSPTIKALLPHEFRYDGLDRVVSATTGVTAITRQFDSLGQLVQESRDGTDFEVFHDYLNGRFERGWPDGRRERVSTNLNGFPTRIERVNNGTLGNHPPVLGTFVPAGVYRIGSGELLERVQFDLLYDAKRRFTRLTYGDPGSPIEQIDYRYDTRDRRRIERWSKRERDSLIHVDVHIQGLDCNSG